MRRPTTDPELLHIHRHAEERASEGHSRRGRYIESACVTRAAEAGVDLVTLAAMLGHSRVQMVMRYAHPTEEHLAWARLGAYQNSINILRRAAGLAEDAGARSNAALAAITLIEEHRAKRLSETESFIIYLRADELLKSSQSAEDIARLRGCARILFRRLVGLSLHDRNFSLHGVVHDLESRFIEQALDEAQGSVAHAAELLGVGYQYLINLLKTRHKRLAGKRTPAKKRRRSIIKNDENHL